jgi:hypothetical protein
LLFEMTVGLFYPAYGCIKSERIPEEIRSAVMNIFRYALLKSESGSGIPIANCH